MKRIVILPFVMICSLVLGQTIKIPMDAVSLEYNNYYHKAYAAIGYYDQHYPNSLIQLNPYNGTVEKKLSLNDEPGVIKTTPDKKHMYLSFLSAPHILKIDLNSFTVVDTIETNGAVVYSFDIMPGNENMLAVVKDGTPYPSVCLFDNGQLLPKQVSTGYDYPEEICFNEDGTRLFGYASNGDGYRMNIAGSGIEYDSITFEYMVPTRGEFKRHNGLLYDGYGLLLDAFSDSIPKIVAWMPVYKFLFVYCAGSEYSELHGCFLYGHENNSHAWISFFDGQNLNYLGSIDVDDYCDVVQEVTVVDQDDFILRSFDTENYTCLLFHHGTTKNKVFLKGKKNMGNWETKKNYLCPPYSHTHTCTH